MKNKILRESEGIIFTKTHVTFDLGTGKSVMEIKIYLDFVRRLKKTNKVVRQEAYKEKQRIKSKVRLK